MGRWIALALGLAAGTASAQQYAAETLTLEVAQTVTLEVGMARGAACDDPMIVRAEITEKTAETNVFVATGLAPGRTYCRAGTADLYQATVLFEITVVPAKPARRP